MRFAIVATLCGLLGVTNATGSQATAQLAQQVQTLDREQLHEVLRTAGYDDVFLGRRAGGEAAGRPASADAGTMSMLLDEAEFAHHCRTVVMRTDASEPELARKVERQANAEDPGLTSFIERSETLMSAGPERNSLDCDCETYKCHCKKQCFCKLQAKSFTGQPVPNPPEPPAGDAKDGGEKPAIPDHQFKCTCSFDGVGGGGASPGGTMDCDCKVADCTCDRQCVCRSKPTSFRFQEESEPQLETREASQAEHADPAVPLPAERAAAGVAVADIDSNTY